MVDTVVKSLLASQCMVSTKTVEDMEAERLSKDDLLLALRGAAEIQACVQHDSSQWPVDLVAGSFVVGVGALVYYLLSDESEDKEADALDAFPGIKLDCAETETERSNYENFSAPTLPAWAVDLQRITSRVVHEVEAIKRILPNIQSQVVSSGPVTSSEDRVASNDHGNDDPDLDQITSNIREQVDRLFLLAASPLQDLTGPSSHCTDPSDSPSTTTPSAAAVSPQSPTTAAAAAIATANFMIMFASNLLQHPCISRYSRLSSTNQAFKSSLGQLDEQVCADLLLSIGMEKKGQYFEWSWGRGLSVDSFVDSWQQQCVMEFIRYLKEKKDVKTTPS